MGVLDLANYVWSTKREGSVVSRTCPSRRIMVSLAVPHRHRVTDYRRQGMLPSLSRASSVPEEQGTMWLPNGSRTLCPWTAPPHMPRGFHRPSAFQAATTREKRE